MKRFPRRRLVLGLLLLGGCIHEPSTTRERAASFAAFAGQRVGAERLQDFVIQRTALLIGGLDPSAVSALPVESVASALKEVHGRYAIGSAAAIDARGYFLTAAHCLDWQPLHVLYAHNGGVAVSAARVVWHGDASVEGGDLAVLAIDQALDRHFSWAEQITAGEPVIGVGPNYDYSGHFGIGCFSGVALKFEAHTAGIPSGSTVFHSAPMHLGDSGGPLTTTDGRLVAINVGDIHELNLLRFAYRRASRAHRPDLEWLRALVEADFISTHRRATSALKRLWTIRCRN